MTGEDVARFTGRPYDGPPYDAVPIDMHQRAPVPLLRQALRDAVGWLLETSQPPGALVPPEGYAVMVGNTRMLVVSPYGVDRCATVNVQRIPRYLPQAPARAGEEAVPARRTDNPLDVLELRDLALELQQLGARPHRVLDGCPLHTGTVLLGVPVEPSLADAVDAHRAGCLTHPVVNAAPDAPGCVSCACGWDRRGRGLAVLPEGAWFERDAPRDVERSNGL